MVGRHVQPGPCSDGTAARRKAVRCCCAPAACSGATRWACTRLDDVSLALRAGEIVGIAGVSGNGQSELLDVLSGLLAPQPGDARGRRRSASRRRTGCDPTSARELRIAHVPEDRHRRGLVLPFAAWESAVLGYQQRPRYGRRGWMRQPVMRDRHRRDDGALRRAPARLALRMREVLRRQPAEAGAGARGAARAAQVLLVGPADPRRRHRRDRIHPRPAARACATPAARCWWCRPNSTRSWRWPTACW